VTKHTETHRHFQIEQQIKLIICRKMEDYSVNLALKTRRGVQITAVLCCQDEEISNSEIATSFSRESVPTGTNIDRANLVFMASTSSSCERISTGINY